MVKMPSLPLPSLLLAMGVFSSPSLISTSFTGPITCEAFTPVSIVVAVAPDRRNSMCLSAPLTTPPHRSFAHRRTRTTTAAELRTSFTFATFASDRDIFDDDNEGEPFAASRSGASTTFSRADFVSRSLALSLATLSSAPNARAFEGGVGGLGKTRPQMGVVFRDPEAALAVGGGNGDDLTSELVAPDGTPALVTFSAPWPILRTAAGIESRDLQGGLESAFIQVAELPKGKGVTSEDLKPSFLSDCLFGSTGKYGMYGEPTDIKIKKLPGGGAGTATIYVATFTTLTPAMRESDRKAYISASVVGNGAFLLVTTTTAVRFGKLEGKLRGVAESFSAVPAPKSSLLRGGSGSRDASPSSS